MKRTYQYIALAAIALSAVACTQHEEFDPQDTSDEVKVSAAIAIEMQTRVTEASTGEVTFDPNDQIKVTNVSRPENDTKREATYTYSGTAWNKTAGTLCWYGTDDNEFQAVYPATAEYGSFTIADQNTGVVDWMTATTTEAKGEDAAIDLSFSHRLAKVTVNVEWNEQYAGTSNASIGEASIMTKADKVVWDGTALTLAEDSGEKWIKACVDSESTTQNFSAIIYPGTYSIGDYFLKVIPGNTNDELLAPMINAVTLTAGKHYTFSLLVGKKFATIDKIEVDLWTTHEFQGVEAEKTTNE